MKRTPALLTILPLVAVAIVYVSSSVLAQADPLLGTWTVDVAKSKFDPGPATKSSTVVFAAGTGTGVKVTVDTVSGAGDKTHWEYSAQYDGKDVPVTGTNPDADMISMTRISPRVTESVYKKAGKVTLTNRRTVSADGKTLTVTQTGTNGKGQKVNNHLVYTKG